ncbi:hypothetical protein HAX54_005340 [Datura stramonium]|uniref:Uncharacterized protein n=1 Tax=Datura stramonium TaxID=4076 RepID=A0ABS8T9A3_DATST|nr:hypothetical protein [Datura stramonium]
MPSADAVEGSNMGPMSVRVWMEEVYLDVGLLSQGKHPIYPSYPLGWDSMTTCGGRSMNTPYLSHPPTHHHQETRIYSHASPSLLMVLLEDGLWVPQFLLEDPP